MLEWLQKYVGPTSHSGLTERGVIWYKGVNWQATLAYGSGREYFEYFSHYYIQVWGDDEIKTAFYLRWGHSEFHGKSLIGVID